MHSWPQEEGDSYRRLGRALEKYVLGADWPWLWVSPGADLRHGPTSANERSQKSTCVSLNRKLALDPSHSQQISRKNINMQLLPNSNSPSFDFLSQYLYINIKLVRYNLRNCQHIDWSWLFPRDQSIQDLWRRRTSVAELILGNIFWGDISKWLMFGRKI